MKNKIAIKVETPELSRIVQEFLFSKGFGWGLGNNTIMNEKASYLHLNYRNKNRITHCEGHMGRQVLSAATQFGEIISVVKKMAERSTSIEVELDQNNTMRVFKDGIQWGADKFPLSVIDKLVEARKKILEC
jgi:hypothetical protein